MNVVASAVPAFGFQIGHPLQRDGGLLDVGWTDIHCQRRRPIFESARHLQLQFAGWYFQCESSTRVEEMPPQSANSVKSAVRHICLAVGCASVDASGHF